MRFIQYFLITFITFLMATGSLSARASALEGFWVSTEPPERNMPEFIIFSEGVMLSGVTTYPGKGGCIHQSNIYTERLCVLAVGRYELNSSEIRFFQLQPGLNSGWAREAGDINDTFLSFNAISFGTRQRDGVLDISSKEINLQLSKSGEVNSDISSVYEVLSSRLHSQEEKALAVNLIDINSYFLDLQATLDINDGSIISNHTCILKTAMNPSFARETRVSARLSSALIAMDSVISGDSVVSAQKSVRNTMRDNIQALSESDYPPFATLYDITEEALRDNPNPESDLYGTINLAYVHLRNRASDNPREPESLRNSKAAEQVLRKWLLYSGLRNDNLDNYSAMIKESGLLESLNCAD